MEDAEPFTYEKPVIAIAETANGLRVRVEGTTNQFWVPKEAIHYDSEVWENGHEGKLIVAEWLAEKRGWV